jgi:hypothetical protein
MRFVALIVCITAAATADETLPDSWIVDEPAPAAQPSPADGVSIIYKADFENGIDGWQCEEWDEYKPWNKVELTTENTFRSSRHSLKTTVPNYWKCLGPVRKLDFKENGTKVSFAYFGRYCTGVVGQAMNAALKTNMHAEVRPYVDGEWRVGTVEVAKFVTWSASSPPAAGAPFSTLMIYAPCNMQFSNHFFLIDNVVVYDGDDRTPPARPQKLAAQVDWNEGVVRISWEEPLDNVGVARFHVYRGVTADFVVSPKSLVGTTCGLFLDDASVPNFGVFFYRVVAEDFALNLSAPSPALAVRVAEKE